MYDVSKNILKKNYIICLFDDNRQNDCIINIKPTHTQKKRFDFIYNMNYKVEKSIRLLIENE